MITYCEDCDNVSNRKDDPYKWICAAAPNFDAKGFVHRTFLAWKPYQECRRVNVNGNCSLFIKKRQPTGEENVSS